MNSNWIYPDNAYPSAKDMANLLETPAMVKEDVAYFEPYYLKDFVALKSTNIIILEEGNFGIKLLNENIGLIQITIISSL